MTAMLPEDGLPSVVGVVGPVDPTDGGNQAQDPEPAPVPVVRDMGGTFTPVVRIPYRSRADIADDWDKPRCRAVAGRTVCLEVLGHEEFGAPHTAWARDLPVTVWDGRGHWHPMGAPCGLDVCPRLS